MKEVGQFNKISEQLRKSIKPLGKDEQVHYRLLTGEFDIVTGEDRFGSQQVIPGRDTIVDPGTGNFVEIGVVKSHKNNQVTRAKKFVIAPVGENTATNGIFTLQGGSLAHQEFYMYFEISNFNKSNPNRDQSIRPLFERINEVAEAEAEEVVIDSLTKALVRVSQMSAAEIKAFAATRNWNLKTYPAVLRTQVKKYAQEFPDEFLAAQDDPEANTKVVIKRALDAGTISYQPHENKIVWKNGKTLANLDKPQDGETEVELFAAWLLASKNGDAILKSLKNTSKNTGADQE